MAQRQGSSIYSSLFMDDPVPIRDVAIKPSTKELVQEVYYKGEPHHHPSNNSYVYEGGDDDVYVINNNGTEFQLHRSTLRETLTELKDHQHKSIRLLEPDNTELFRDVVEALRLLYGSGEPYDLVMEDIHEIFPENTHMKPGTVAAFFAGCFGNDNFPGPAGCSPKCVANIPSESKEGECNDLVLLYGNGAFTSLNDVTSTHAFIYIENEPFNGFTRENVKELSDAGIDNASIIFGNPDGSYRDIKSDISIDQLPIDDSTTSSSSGQVAAGVVFLLLVLVIAALLFWFYKNYYMVSY